VCRRLIPGYLFNIEEHPRSDFNRDYILVRVSHSGTQPHGEDAIEGHFEYNNEFRCIPGDVTFRPTRKTPRPRVQGTQTAIVTGPSGEEIYPDEHGRVKVQFHWDREGQYDENTSCWIRVSQLWAGKNWGAMWIPRIGHEVIVDFLEGDPDKPIIIGRVYHGDNPPPYGLPDDKTKSTIKSDSSVGGGGSNEIRFEDLKGSEEVYIHAQKDMSEVIENDMSTSVGNDQSLSVAHDRTKSVSNDETTTVTGNRTETVENGNETITINTGDRKIDVNTGDNILTVKTGDRKVDVNTGDDILTVKTGDRKVDVNTGDDLLVVKTGDYKVDVNTGDAVLTVKTGDRSVAVNAGDYQVATKSGDIKIDAKSNLEGKAAAEMILDAPKIGITGKSEVQITVGGSAIKLEPAKITLSSGSGQIILDPAGVTIVGALVKIN